MLAQNGVPVRIIDKNAVPRIGQRGAGTQPRTLELYSIAGILPEIMEHALDLPMMSVHAYGVKEPIKTAPMSVKPDPSPTRPIVSQ